MMISVGMSLTIFAKSSTVDIWLGFKYASRFYKRVEDKSHKKQVFILLSSSSGVVNTIALHNIFGPSDYA